jgi:hypothetical protein
MTETNTTSWPPLEIDPGLDQALHSIWRNERSFAGGTVPNVITDTYQSSVIIARDAPEPYVIKIPKDTANAAKLGDLESDVHNWLTIASFKQPPPLKVAEGIWWNKEPGYFSLEFLPGEQIYKALNNREGPLSRTEQEQCGRLLGSFVAWMALQLPDGEFGYYLRAMPETPVRPNAQNVITVDRFEALGLHAPAQMARRLIEFGNDRQEDIAARPIIGHRDLHLGNILVDDTSDFVQPAAIIDFGATGPSHPAYEFHVLSALGPHVVPSAINAYQAETGQYVDIALINYWTSIRSLWAIHYRLQQHLPLDAIRCSMELLLPDEDWSELSGK